MTNDTQTPEFREFKYNALVNAGYTPEKARKMRDWITAAVIRKIQQLSGKSWKQANFDFYRDLKDSGIKTEKEPQELAKPLQSKEFNYTVDSNIQGGQCP
jgi:prophage antirepressor-like protein